MGIFESLEARMLCATYALTDLGTLGGTFSRAFGINISGQVVGDATTSTGTHRAFLYSGSALKNLSTLGGSKSIAYSINDLSQIVGESTQADGSTRGFIYAGGSMKSLGTLSGGSTSNAFAINLSGQVAGFSGTSGGDRAVIFSNGTIKNLGALSGASFSRGYGINNAGAVVGNSQSGGKDRAFVYSSGVMKSIPPISGGSITHAYGINASGKVIGESDLGSGDKRAILYDGSTTKNLGTLGGNFSHAFGINSAGAIVGQASNASGAYRAFIYSNGAMKDLNSLISTGTGWTITEANAINDFGQIAVSGVNAKGQTHALLLTPTQFGSVRGTVFNDTDKDGVRDSTEIGLPGVVVYLDRNNNKVMDSSEARTVTDSSGVYRFAAVPLSSDVIIRQIVPAGYQQTAPSNGFGRHANLSTPTSVSGLDFGDAKATTIAGASSSTTSFPSVEPEALKLLE
ncbi:MAG TPA: SdrD B-like domain-containing protein [Tepidisphaeraceae bacterium]|nr:SdrD B-like domain-containing protein [Tepidisphaeraceae bacterium]